MRPERDVMVDALAAVGGADRREVVNLAAVVVEHLHAHGYRLARRPGALASVVTPAEADAYVADWDFIDHGDGAA